MPRLIGRDGRNRLPMIVIIGLLAVSAIALVAFYLFPRPDGASTSRTTNGAGSASPSSSEILEGSYDPAPTGCLGGQARDTAMVLTAQRKAGHSNFGAVEVAAAFFRWGYRYPYPSAGEVKNLRPLFSFEDAAALQRQFISGYRRSYVAPPAGDVATGTPYYLTTANGIWSVDDDSTKNRVVAAAQMHYVVDGSYSATQTVSLTAVLVWQSGAWHLSSLRQSDPARLSAGGTSFTSGC